MSNIQFPSIEDAATLAAVIKNYGVHPYQPDRKTLTIEDAVSSAELGPLLPHAVVEMMVEAQEPLMVLTPLMDRIQALPGTVEYKMPSVGTFSVDRIAEGESYPEKRLNIGGALSTATIDKWGVALAFTDEAIKYSRWDLLSMHVREAGRAFGRRREVEVANHIKGLGNPLFDNRNPTSSQLGVTHGRGRSMAANGTITADDLFDAYASMLTTGYQPDLMIMHPLTWLMFIKDPVLRSWAAAAGGGVVFGGYTGNPVNRYSIPGMPKTLVASGNRNASIGIPVSGGAASTSSDFVPGMNSAPVLPSYLPYNLRIVVSPWVPFDTASKLTDIFLCDSKCLGAIVEEESLTSDNWSDPKTDIKFMKFRERWGILMYEEGMGIGVLKNIKVDQNFFPDFLASPTVDFTSVADIPAGTAVV